MNFGDRVDGPAPDRLEIDWVRPERKATGRLLMGVAACMTLLFATIYGLAFWSNGTVPVGREWLLALVPVPFLLLGLRLSRRSDGVVVDFATRTLRRGDDSRALDATAVVVTRHIKTGTNGKGGRLQTPYWRASLVGEGEHAGLPQLESSTVADLFGEPAANMLLESLNPLPVWDLAKRLAARLEVPLQVLEESGEQVVQSAADVAPQVGRQFDAIEPVRPEMSDSSPTVAEDASGSLSIRWEERRLTSLKSSAALVGLLMVLPALATLVLTLKRGDPSLLALPVVLYLVFLLLLWAIQLLSPYERTLIVDQSSIRLETRGGLGRSASVALPEVRTILLAGGDAPGLRIVGRDLVLCCETAGDAEARWVRWRVLRHLARSASV